MAEQMTIEQVVMVVRELLIRGYVRIDAEMLLYAMLDDGVGAEAKALAKQESIPMTWSAVALVAHKALADNTPTTAVVEEDEPDCDPMEDGHQREVIDWAAKLMADPDGVVFLDTETTGLDNPYPVEIAVVDGRGNTLFDKRIALPEGVTISPGAQGVHGITADDLKDAPAFADVWDELRAVLKGKRVAIYNAAFDLLVLRNAWQSASIAVDMEWLSQDCVMENFARYHGDWNDYHGSYTWVKLVKAARLVGVPVASAHSALGDARMTHGVVKALAAKADPAPA